MENPLPAFHFHVDWGTGPMGFAEVSGLTMEAQPIEYRHGMQKDPIPIQMPGLKKFSNITLKRGVVKGDKAFYEWINSVALNKVERKEVSISMLDEEHNPVVTWKIKDAWPVKVEGPALKASGNEVAIESMELIHEGLTVEYA